MIQARDLGFSFGLASLTFELPERGLVAIAGPNGAGKSTLLGILAGLRSPYRGSVMLEGREISGWPRRDLARKLAYLAQSMRFEFPFRAEELVLMGRAPFAQGWFETSADHDLALAAMEATETIALRDRDVRTLSGGERQRVLLAAALVQQPRILLLDEPATHLDLRHQLDLYRLLRREAREKLVIAVTHDLNLALQFADRILVLHDGRLAANGTPREVLTPDLIWQVFAVRAHTSGPSLHYEIDAQ